MAETIPSKQIVIADVPETEQATAEFIYNFFTADESTNDTGGVETKYLEKLGDLQNAKLINTAEFKRTVPRAIKLQWQIKDVKNRDSNDSFVDKIILSDNLDKIHYEEDFGANGFVSLKIQDKDFNDKTSNLMREIAIEALGTNFSGSAQDASKALNNKVDEKVINGTAISKALGNYYGKSIDFADQVKKLDEAVARARTTLLVNQKIIGDLLADSYLQDPLNPLSTEAVEQIKKTYIVQSSAIKAADSNLFSMSDYDIEISKPINTFAINPDKYDPLLKTIGYIVEKYELFENGTTKTHTPFTVNNPQLGMLLDNRVKYGSSYSYNVRTVAYMEVLGRDEELGQTVIIGFLLTSKPTATANVKCVETLPPPAPADFNIGWDWKHRAPRLTWNFPVNSQRDIKYFQIFRRKTINEPFQLLRMVDFNDSELVIEPLENLIDDELIEKATSPNNTFIDIEAGKQSFIYSVCSVDAHGYSSNYSMQFKTIFVDSLNRLKLELISVAGAPKSYPNALLNVDTFVDTIKDEGHETLTIAFNPEYLKVSDNSSNDLQLLKAGLGETYVIQMTNIDLQEQKKLSISIKDQSDDQIISRTNKQTTVNGMTSKATTLRK